MGIDHKKLAAILGSEPDLTAPQTPFAAHMIGKRAKWKYATNGYLDRFEILEAFPPGKWGIDDRHGVVVIRDCDNQRVLVVGMDSLVTA